MSVINIPLEPKILADWERYKVLQVFDLDMWTLATGIRINDPVIANTLWPAGNEGSEDINTISRLRLVTRATKIPSIISINNLLRLKGMIGSEVDKAHH